MKVVDQASEIADKEEIVLSRFEYQKLVDSKLELSKELQLLRANKIALEQEIEVLEREIQGRHLEKENEKEESIKLLEDLRTILFQS